MAFALAPWHMWGGTQIIALPSGLTVVKQTSQLARVNYARPERWAFLVSAKLIDAVFLAPGNTQTITIDFQLIAGIGRTVVDTHSTERSIGPSGVVNGDGYVSFKFVIEDTGNPLPIGRVKWASQGFSPRFDDTAAGDTAPRVPFVNFVAEDIQAYCTVQFLSNVAPSKGPTFEVSALFAPAAHVRPEWFTDEQGNEPRFRGLEQGGS